MQRVKCCKRKRIQFSIFKVSFSTQMSNQKYLYCLKTFWLDQVSFQTLETLKTDEIFSVQHSCCSFILKWSTKIDYSTFGYFFANVSLWRDVPHSSTTKIQKLINIFKLLFVSCIWCQNKKVCFRYRFFDFGFGFGFILLETQGMGRKVRVIRFPGRK